MIANYEKPALNLMCPKCGIKIATTKREKNDIDDNDYEIILKPVFNPSIKQIKILSNLIGQNFVKSKKLLESGGILLKGKAVEIKEKMIILNKSVIEYSIYPNFPY